MDLRTGAYFIAIMQIIVGLATLASYNYGRWMVIINGLVVALGGGCMLFSAITHNRPGAIAYLVLTGVAIILTALTAILIIIWAKYLATLTIIIALIYFIWMGVLIYFWICGYSFFLRL